MQVVPGVETINFTERKTLDALHEMVPNGPDCSIEAIGFHYTETLLHKARFSPRGRLTCCMVALLKLHGCWVMSCLLGFPAGDSIPTMILRLHPHHEPSNKCRWRWR